ncbi:MAG: HD domain-containing protein [Spirulina sp. SIO3F2]|nr:HD domain-containing protein [Spirulina sp. SIO3F2]
MGLTRSSFIQLRTVEAAYELLRELGAPAKLLLHVQLVGEAAEILLTQLRTFPVHLDERFVRLGVALHDAGKILHPQELTTPGHQHEAAGEQLLIAHGVEPTLARCCRSHAQWQTLPCSLEELLIALADKLWKGRRQTQLETMIIEQITQQSSLNDWTVFMELDAGFEAIAAEGHLQLLRSQVMN